MARWVSYLAAFVLIAHGLIHVLGTTVYLRLGEVTGFAYKTTLLGILERGFDHYLDRPAVLGGCEKLQQIFDLETRFPTRRR